MAQKQNSKKTTQTDAPVEKPVAQKRAKRERRQSGKSYANTIAIVALVLFGGWAAIQAGVLEVGVGAEPIENPTAVDEKEIISRTVVEAGEPLSSSRIALADEDVHQPTSIQVHDDAGMPQAKKSHPAQNSAEHLLQTPYQTFPLLTLATYSAVLAKAPEVAMLLEKLVAVAPEKAMPHVRALQQSLQGMGPLSLADVEKNMLGEPVFAEEHEEENSPFTEAEQGTAVEMPTWWEKTLGQYVRVKKIPQTAKADVVEGTLNQGQPKQQVVLAEIPDETTMYQVVAALNDGQWALAQTRLVDLPQEAPFVQLAFAYMTQRQALAALLQQALSQQP